MERMKNLVTSCYPPTSGGAANDALKAEIIKIENELRLVSASYNTPVKKISSSFKQIFLDQGYTIDPIIEEGYQLTVNAIKGKLILQVQLGNISRFYADLLKCEYLYNKGLISSVIYICFTSEFVKNHYSSNNVTVERALRETLLFREIIKVPISFISIEI